MSAGIKDLAIVVLEFLSVEVHKQTLSILIGIGSNNPAVAKPQNITSET